MGSSQELPTSPHLRCVSLVTKLSDKKKVQNSRVVRWIEIQQMKIFVKGMLND